MKLLCRRNLYKCQFIAEIVYRSDDASECGNLSTSRAGILYSTAVGILRAVTSKCPADMCEDPDNYNTFIKRMYWSSHSTTSSVRLTSWC
jgi:hypothetical protein